MMKKNNFKYGHNQSCNNALIMAFLFTYLLLSIINHNQDYGAYTIWNKYMWEEIWLGT